MRHRTLAALAMLGLAIPAGAEPRADDAARGARIWGTVGEIASDKYEGRGTGTAGYDAAAAVVAARMRALGLRPAGTRGFYQAVGFTAQKVIPAQSSFVLGGAGGTLALKVPEEAILSGRNALPAGLANAPLVFAGYGLGMPGTGHDDFAGLDLRGKVVVVISGGPEAAPGSRKANARSERARVLAAKGALGLIALTTPKQIEIPWVRQIGLASRAALVPDDAKSRDVAGPFLSASVSPAAADALFAGSGHSFAEMAALADASAPVPGFALARTVSAWVVVESRPVRSANLVAVLPGRDKLLAKQYVVLSAHLDGYGIGEAVNGDAIYNGAIDNAAGVASVLEIARELVRGKRRPRRSVLFLLPTAEEAGLLGSRYFVENPTVPRSALVADINFDMPLPIFPLTSVTPVGYEESSLGETARAVSARFGLPVVPDPFPDRNVFIRSDQYNFVKAGIPSLFMKFGFARGTPEAEVERAWRANIYHSPRDAPGQTVMPAEIGKFARYVTALLRDVADAPARPRWHSASYFAGAATGN